MEAQNVRACIVCADRSISASLVRQFTLIPVIETTAADEQNFDTALEQGLRILRLAASKGDHLADFEPLARFREALQRRTLLETDAIQQALSTRNHDETPISPAQNHPPPALPALNPGELRAEQETLDDLQKTFRPRLVTSRPPRETTTERKLSLDYSPPLRAVIAAAREIAVAYGNPRVTAGHFLAGILDTPGSAAYAALEVIGADLDKIAMLTGQSFPPAEDSPDGSFELDKSAREAIRHAKLHAIRKEQLCLTTLNLLKGISELGGPLTDSGLTIHQLSTAVEKAGLPDECAAWLETQPPPHKPEPPPDWNPSAFAEKMNAREQAITSGSASFSSESRVEEGEAPIKTVRVKFSRVKCNSENPSLDVVENTADQLLEGRIVALPTEAGYYAGVDATNERAISRLLAIRNLSPSKPVHVITHSTTVFANLGIRVDPRLEPIFESFWPGPLVIVLPRRARSFQLLAADSSIGIRIPDSYVTLGVLSMLQRPVAVIGLTHKRKHTGKPDDVEQQYSRTVDVLLDCGEIQSPAKVTVLSAMEEKFEMVREGAISAKQLESVLQHKIVRKRSSR
jgi:tRNA threonylcarbamoyl adenosine modification protein (Sua5/YciO/YrdC/YwlC family)